MWLVLYLIFSLILQNRMRHKGKGRLIMPGQRVHASVCFIEGDYVPKARFHPDFGGAEWKKIIGVGKLDNVAWAEGIERLLEMDLFDISGIPQVIRKYTEEREPDPKEWSERLEFLASIRTSMHHAWIREIDPFL